MIKNIFITIASLLLATSCTSNKADPISVETTDELTAPTITTKDGNQAIMRVVEIHRYPQDYDVETGCRTAPVVKPEDWEDFELGVVLKVTPELDENEKDPEHD